MKLIGILGGMGPQAGVRLHQLVIEATPANKDQDHLDVVHYSASHVRDRSASLAADGGRAYLNDVIEAAQLLVRARVAAIGIPCNTAHSRLKEIQAGVAVPIVNMIDLTVRQLVRDYPGVPVGLLATDGTMATQVYQKASPDSGIKWIVPEPAEQKIVMGVIYGVIKAKPKLTDITNAELAPLVAAARGLVERGAGVIVAGCTELSLVTDALAQAGVPVVDPMRILAEELVRIGKE
jgi:aspartate racemase